WDPKTFSGLSYVATVPTTHLLNPQAWVMAAVGNRLGYQLCVVLFVLCGAYGTYLFCRRRLAIDWRFSLCAGLSFVFAPLLCRHRRGAHAPDIAGVVADGDRDLLPAASRRWRSAAADHQSRLEAECQLGHRHTATAERDSAPRWTQNNTARWVLDILL